MASKPSPTKSPIPSTRRNVKTTPVAAVNAALASPATPQSAAPSEALIAQTAYQIWLSQGQESGCDQKHWFEAKLQLQHT